MNPRRKLMQCNGCLQPVACYRRGGSSGQAAKHWAAAAAEVSGVAAGFVCLQITEIGEISPVWGVSAVTQWSFQCNEGAAAVGSWGQTNQSYKPFVSVRFWFFCSHLTSAFLSAFPPGSCSLPLRSTSSLSTMQTPCSMTRSTGMLSASTPWPYSRKKP